MLKLRYFGYLMRRTDSLEKTLMLGKIEGMRRRGWQRMRWMASLTRWTWVWVSSRSWWWTGKADMAAAHGGHKELDMTEQLNWIELMGSGVVSKVCLWKVLIRLKVTWETLVEMLLLLLTCFSCVWLCVTPQTPPSMGFFRQEYWSGLPFPSPMHACMLSHFSHVQLCATPWIAAHQAPLSMNSLGKNTGVGCRVLLWTSKLDIAKVAWVPSPFYCRQPVTYVWGFLGYHRNLPIPIISRRNILRVKKNTSLHFGNCLKSKPKAIHCQVLIGFPEQFLPAWVSPGALDNLIMNIITFLSGFWDLCIVLDSRFLSTVSRGMDLGIHFWKEMIARLSLWFRRENLRAED